MTVSDIRRGSRRFFVLGLLIAAMAGTWPTADSVAQETRCDIRAATTVAANSEARVVRKRGVLYGCAYRSGKPVQLGADNTRGCDESTGCEGIIHVALAGRFVSYAFLASSRDSAQTSLHLVDLRLRRRSTKWTSPPPARQGDFTGISDLAVTRQGHVAWITISTSPAEAGVSAEVHIDRGQGDVVADSGRDTIDAQSLASNDKGVFFWLHGDQARASR
jgi:hypothetical protein